MSNLHLKILLIHKTSSFLLRLLIEHKLLLKRITISVVIVKMTILENLFLVKQTLILKYFMIFSKDERMYVTILIYFIISFNNLEVHINYYSIRGFWGFG